MDGPNAQQQLTQREETVSGFGLPQTQTGAEFVRSKILEITGGLPDYRGPLNARITGKLTNPRYTLEKVIFESLPHYYVTANLYRPNQPGRYPAVRCPPGTLRWGKPRTTEWPRTSPLKDS